MADQPISIETTATSFHLVVDRGDQPALRISLEPSQALPLFREFWRALGTFYPRDSDDPERSSPPFVLSESSVETRPGANSEGQVYMWLGPADLAAVKFYYSPEHARSVANGLLESASVAETLARPKN